MTDTGMNRAKLMRWTHEEGPRVVAREEKLLEIVSDQQRQIGDLYADLNRWTLAAALGWALAVGVLGGVALLLVTQ